MVKLKHWMKKLIMVPVWIMLPEIILSAVMLIMIFTKGLDSHPVAYIVYVFSFYTLVVWCVRVYKELPVCSKKIKERIHTNRFADRYFTDAAYKTHVNLFFSLGINIIYIGINIASAVVYKSRWFTIFAVYYGIMAAMKILLVNYAGKNQIGSNRLKETKRAVVCAYILMSVNIILSGVVLMMVYNDKGFNYRGFLIYVMALYTFYSTTSAVISLIKYRKYNSPVMSVSKLIKLAASLFSMLFLETAMFAQFGLETPDAFKRIMIMVTGAGICILIVAMSLYVIIHGTKLIKKEK